MTKLLIVEDEKKIRQGIINVIDWQSHDIHVCGEAENGKIAIDLVNQLSPDIILLDIRMPVMNGLEVMETLKKSNAKVKIMLLSGFDDFSYVQKALRNGACDYLLKPCDPADMLNAVLKVKMIKNAC